MENCKEKFNDYEPLENLKFIIKDGEIICLTPAELAGLYFLAEKRERSSRNDTPIPEKITINFPHFGNINLRNYRTLAIYLSENNIFEIKLRSDEVRKMQVLSNVIEDMIDEFNENLYELVAKEDDTDKILPQTFNLREKVESVLEIDSNFRKHGVDKDLYTVNDLFRSDIQLFDRNDIFYITNLQYDRDMFPKEHKKNPDFFKTEWKEYIEDLFPEFPYENILMAGGHICAMLSYSYWVSTSGIDLDLFVYGIKDKNIANRKLEQLISYFDETHGIYSLNISKNCVSLQLGNKMRIDIVLRLYNTKSEILHGFDIGAAAVGWDGEEILFTTLSKFTYDYQTIIVDLSRRSTTFEKRLVKYVNRTCYNLIFYDFNMGKIHDFEEYMDGNDLSKIYRMNYIILTTVSRFNINEVYGEYFSSIKSRQKFIPHNKPLSLISQSLLKFNNVNNTDTCDYKPSSSNSHNIKCLLNDDLENIYFKITQFGNTINGENLYGKINMDAIKNVDKIINEEFLVEHYEKIIINDIYSDELPDYDVNDNILKVLFIILRNQNYFVKPYEILRYIVSGKISGRDVNNFLKRIINKNIRKIKKNAKKINDKDRTKLFHWNVQNPTTQLTSSINPLIKDPKDWYGKFY